MWAFLKGLLTPRRIPADRRPLDELGDYGSVIDYGKAVSGDLRLIPEGEALDALKSDYQEMISSGLFEEEPSPFEVLMSQCHAIELEANR
ncbi:hypothetical protein [Stenotrophomonas acidaminiphila]|jgi:hypothetical protein|uniref:hypothetical protein n=1 Tax=Stenotrophomonas acidaminiphila TaxID=128780 RepID=UPI0024AD64D3|nr:hypothetical protein [Stenotrophomonas acidaminiphila]WHL19932.1 hypothetical protein QLF99_05830 [Stenotrophomonas acidaminiphila]